MAFAATNCKFISPNCKGTVLFFSDLIKMEGGTNHYVGCSGKCKVVPRSQSAQCFFPVCLCLISVAFQKGSEDLAFTKQSTFNIFSRKAFYPLKRVKLNALCPFLVNAKYRRKTIGKEHARLLLHVQQDLLGYDGKRERDRQSLTALPFCDLIRGLVDLKGCRLWRQQLAGFVLVELTGSRAVKLLRGVGFSQLDRHQFFPPVSWDATGSLIRMHSEMDLAQPVSSCMQLAEVSWGGKSDSLVCLFLYLCVGDCLQEMIVKLDSDILLMTFKQTFRLSLCSYYVDFFTGDCFIEVT